MPELPDIQNYLRALEARTLGTRLQRIRIASPFVLRSFAPPASDLEGRMVFGLRRLGKRIVFALEEERFLVIHLMIAGRLHWRAVGAKLAGRASLAAFDFESGTLVLTEASTKKRAAVVFVRGEENLADFDPGGLEVLGATIDEFTAALRGENHTVKRSLTDPRLFSGIGNAYSDEILHRARLSPFKLTSRMTDEEIAQLHGATHAVLTEWVDRLAAETGDSFPEKVTAFHAAMAVHGRYGKPCPDCGSPVQRIEYADRESNYCAICQNEGRLLADRGLSRLLKTDWPRTLEEMEDRKANDRAVMTRTE